MKYEDVETENDVLSRDPVIGFLVTKTRDGDVLVRPLTFDWQGYGDDLTLGEDERVIGVLPAPPGSYLVWGFPPSGRGIRLGYEFPGADAPDWKKELESRARF